MPENPIRLDTGAYPTRTSSWLPSPRLTARQRHGSPGSVRPRAAAPSLYWLIWSVSFPWSIWLVWFNQRNEMASSRGKVEIMPQDMVVMNLSDIDVSTAPNDPRPSAACSAIKNPQCLFLCRIWQHLFYLSTNGNPGQALSPYNPKYLLLKMPYRFNTSYQLLARRSGYVLCTWSLSPNLQRSCP